MSDLSACGCLLQIQSPVPVGSIGLLDVEIEGIRYAEWFRVVRIELSSCVGEPHVIGVEFLQLADAPELIAHEIEHIIEQLDGVNLAARAVMTGSGVHATNVGEVWYETERATRVGLTVAADMRRTRR